MQKEKKEGKQLKKKSLGKSQPQEKSQLAKLQPEELLQNDIASLVNDPLGYVYYNFPWGEKPLHEAPYNSPDEWQIDVLTEYGEALQDPSDEPIKITRRSGHGIGKTTLMAWINHHFISTRPHPQIITTANTKDQLTHKTWRELAKWNRLARNKHWFEWTATKFYHKSFPETWFALAQPWSKERSEAFAGTHEKYVLLQMDEASAIDDIIWEVAEGATTTPKVVWFAFGNATRNTGRFAECFKKFRHRWNTGTIDSRTSKIANQDVIQKWLEDYGEDSDFFRVRVKGEEPRAGDMQFIAGDIVDDAYGKQYKEMDYYRQPKILGVDVARFGMDQCAIIKRQGMASWDLKKHRGSGKGWLMVFAKIVAQEIDAWQPDAVFVDEIGMGSGVVDRLHQLGYDQVIGVNSAVREENTSPYFNKRAFMWGRMRAWLESGGAIPADDELKDDLIGPEYGYAGANDQTQLESKEDMAKRGLASPDSADALALTFAEPVQAKEDAVYDLMEEMSERSTYDPLTHR